MVFPALLQPIVYDKKGDKVSPIDLALANYDREVRTREKISSGEERAEANREASEEVPVVV
jgi:hypothetical protein